MRIDQIKFRWGVFRIVHCFKRTLRKKFGASSIVERNYNRLRLELTGVGMTLRFLYCNRAASLIIAFIREISWRNYLSEKFDNFSDLMDKLNRKMKKQLAFRAARFKILKSHFQKEVDHYAIDLTRSKKKEDKLMGK